MLKYLLLSDGHFSLRVCPAEMEVILRLALRLIGETSRLGRFITEYYENQKADHMAAVLEQAYAGQPYDGLISLGDSLSGWNQTGLDQEDEATLEAMYFKNILTGELELAADKQIWVPGNHDLGYLNCSFASVGIGYPAEKNFSSYQELYGPAYGLKWLSDQLAFIWLSTVHVETLNIKPGKTSDVRLDFLIHQQEQELAFLAKALKALTSTDKFILGIHDPGSFLCPQLQEVLNHHLPQLAASFVGHIHAELLLKLFKAIRPSFRLVLNKYQTQFIPSIWGMVLPLFFWPIGAGWAELEINGASAQLHLHTIGLKKIKTIVLC